MNDTDNDKIHILDIELPSECRETLQKNLWMMGASRQLQADIMCGLNTLLACFLIHKNSVHFVG